MISINYFIQPWMMTLAGWWFLIVLLNVALYVEEECI